MTGVLFVPVTTVAVCFDSDGVPNNISLSFDTFCVIN